MNLRTLKRRRTMQGLVALMAATAFGRAVARRLLRAMRLPVDPAA